MKVQLLGKKLNSGMSTLEILIAFSIVIVCMSAIIVVAFSNQSVTVDSQINNEAIFKAQALLEKARADSRNDYSSVKNCDDSSSAKCSGTYDSFYNRILAIDPTSITQCGEDIKSSTSWTEGTRNLSIDFTTHLGDISSAVALGGTCDSTPPPSGWNPPATWASSNFNPGKPTGLDVLSKIVYMSADKTPFLEIADTNGVAQGTSSGLFLSFTNGFDDSIGYSKYAKMNDIRVAKYQNGKIYAFAARDTGTNAGQFEVIDVTTPTAPVSKAVKSLAGVSGSYPAAWRLYYFDNKVYVVTQFTAGPELHVFDVSDPTKPSEIGTGTDLGRTVEGLVVTKKIISSVTHYVVYMATDKNSAPLSVYDITYPPSTINVNEATSAEPSFSKYQDGQAVYAIGSYLYFGRMSDPSGSDLFVYDISNPLSGSALPLIGQADIGTSVIGLSVSGSFAFLATAKLSNEFQAWTSSPSNLTRVSNFNFPNVIYNGIKYQDSWVYVASQGNDALRIIYNGQ